MRPLLSACGYILAFRLSSFWSRSRCYCKACQIFYLTTFPRQGMNVAFYEAKEGEGEYKKACFPKAGSRLSIYNRKFVELVGKLGTKLVGFIRLASFFIGLGQVLGNFWSVGCQLMGFFQHRQRFIDLIVL